MKFIVYDNNQKILQHTDGLTGTVVESLPINGAHNVVINAWDSGGAFYQSSVKFQVTGEGFVTPCPAPASPGINFCAPTPNVVLGPNYTVSATAKGISSIAAIRFYIDNKVQLTQSNTNQLTSLAIVGSQGDHGGARLD